LERNLSKGPLGLLLGVALSLAVVGCGEQSAASPASSPSPRQTAEPSSVLGEHVWTHDDIERACNSATQPSSVVAVALGPAFNGTVQITGAIPPENYTGCGFQMEPGGLVEFDLATFPLTYHLDDGSPLNADDSEALGRVLQEAGYRRADDYAATAGAASAFTHTTTNGLTVVLVGGLNVWFIDSAATIAPDSLAAIATALQSSLGQAD
jgi:hypothetical protein